MHCLHKAMLCRKVLGICMEYASAIWDPHLIKDSDALERVQRRAARWITNKHDRTAGVSSLLQHLHLEPSKNAGVSVDWHFCTKSWTWGCRWIISIWFCVIDCQRIHCSAETQDTPLCLNPVPEVLCCKNCYWVELTAGLHHLVGFGIVFQKPALCHIVSVDVHTSLP